MTDGFAGASFPPPKERFTTDFAPGDEVAETFLIASASQAQAKNGPYWRIDFRDAKGTVGGKIWSPQSLAYPELPAGTAVFVKGRVTTYRDKSEFAVDSLRLLTDEEFSGLALADFLPASAYSPDEMLEALRELARKTLVHKPWRKFVLSLLNDEEIGAALRFAPAAKAMHHAYAGGLLEHTLSVVRLCLRIAENYPQLDKQALFAGAVCHDLGKIWELSAGLAVDYTTQGKLIGHISLAAEKLQPFLAKSGLAPEQVDHLKHLVLSHHGTKEFGSPVLPATAEALVLHYADNIDAKLQQVFTAFTGLEKGESGWSAYNPSLERALFRPVPTPESAPRTEGKPRKQEEKEDDPAAPKPLSLFD